MTQASYKKSINLVSHNTVLDGRSEKGEKAAFRTRSLQKQATLLLSLFASLSVLLILDGCGGGGYTGATLTSISARSLAIDAGQSIAVTASAGGGLPLSWTLSGTSCTGATCGTLSNATGQSTTYTAPAGLATQLKVTLQVAIAGTTSSQTVPITANPVPVISTPPPAGTQGVAYSTTISVQGGTAPFHLSLPSGSTPPGLTFNAATGVLSGTPTASGTFSFPVQAVDSSNAPFTATATESLVIAPSGSGSTGSGGTGSGGTGSGGTGSGSGGTGAGGSGTGSPAGSPSVVSMALPEGVLATPYSASLKAIGGRTPYRWSTVGGSLPSGLTLDANTGIISGTPVAQGSFPFTAQVQDNAGATATGIFSITVTAPTNTAMLTLTTGTLPSGTTGVPYSTTVGIAGGTAPYGCSVAAGTLPAGLSLGAGCAISGVPSAAGTSTLTLTATDAATPADTTTGVVTLVINPAATLMLSSPPAATVGSPYTGSIGVMGGVAPYSCSVVGGTLPNGLTLGANCVLSGTPTAAGATSVTVSATDGATPANMNTAAVTISVNPAATALTLGSLADGTVSVPYSATLGVGGGTAPYNCTVTSGTLPAGLTLGTQCAVSGTPTTAGTSTITVQAGDASSPANTTSGQVSLTIEPAVSLTLSAPPTAAAGTPYNASVGVTGGTAPYSCSLTAGTLPAGLTLAGNCVVSGTPTTAGTSTITVQASDASSPANTTSGQVSLTVAPSPLSFSLGTLPNGVTGTPYTATIGVTGGTSPYLCSITAGTLPSGLALASNCVVSGTPTAAGTSTVSVNATDSANPANSTTGQVNLTIAAAPTSLTFGTLPSGTTGMPYSATLGVMGGTAPYTCATSAGSLPAGLTLASNCLVSGTPTTAGTVTFTVQAADSANPATTATGQVMLTVAAAPATLTFGTLPDGTTGTPYSATLGVTGGTAPYTCSITSGTLPAGLTLASNCLVSGTPTTSGTSTVSVKATDSANPANSNTGQVSLTVNPAVTLMVTGPAGATVGTPYTGSIGVSGGTAPYSCVITAGTLPQGLGLGTHCSITGTPTTAGSANVTVQATDASSPANSTTATVSLTVSAAPITLTLASPAAATVSTPYTGTIPVTGGTAPYTCTVNSGALPNGLSLGANCSLTGTPTAVGSTVVSIMATDSSSPAATKIAPVTITVNPLPALTFTGSLPNAVLGLTYSQTLAAAGGLAPYTYAVTAGNLPAGLSLSSAGVLSGTPTTAGASSFTVTATDSEGTPQTVSLPLVLLVTYAVTATDAELTGPYAFLFQGYDDTAAGVLAYQTATVGSLNADGAGVISAGELDANHQGSTATGNTVSSQKFLGTYTLGADGRGSLTVSVLNADGTVAGTQTYALAIKAPASPATVATEGSLIEYDGNQVTGTRGSGTLLAQTTAAFAGGLNGSYAFGLQGDTPCLVSCALNLNLFGPVAEVGQFTTASGTVTGTADANIAATNYPSSNLSGTFGTADSNGRLSLSLTNASLPTGVSPTDYAVYVINANQAFVLSTDKHSAFVLLAGQAQLQTQATFSNVSESGPYVGYENSPTNPGLLGQTLQTVANLSTATIFEGQGNGEGTCTTNSVTQGGVTGLINTLTGLGSVASTLQGVFGSYTQTGTSACTVATQGREVLNYVAPLVSLPAVGSTPAPRVAYLYAPNQGFFLETGYAGLGRLEQQSGAPFTVGTLNGTFVYGSTPASSVASTNASGTFTANGQGTANTTLDENVGVGTVNLLQLGIAGTFPYSLTNATFGTYQLGTTDVIYAIAPGRFVLLDTNATTTSPSVALIY